MENKKIRVVLADDHAVVRRGLRRLLEKGTDIQVVGEAGTGASALQLVYELKPDLLLLDIEMPDIKGDQVAAELRRRKVPVSILVLSTCDDSHFIQEMLLHVGVDAYLTKDAKPEKIRQTVYQLSQNAARLQSLGRWINSFVYP